ncbi:hypothetical protein M408DRAFT_59130, partial [Serendipita vermifera MAFF 305830]
TGFGDCDGPVQPDGKTPRVPCNCPPLKDAYIQALTANVQAGRAVNNTNVRVTFPTGNSVQDKKGRITAAVITLQNLKAAGVGCPGVSTTFAQQNKNLDTCGDFLCGGAPAVTSPPAATTTPAPVAAAPLVDRLAPQLGSQPNNNPNGSGDCDGPRQPDGSVKLVPCACPPVREEFINQLLANIQAGHAVRNPSVKLSFPTGNSKADQHAR